MLPRRSFLCLLCAALSFLTANLTASEPKSKTVDFSFDYKLVAGPGLIPESLIVEGQEATFTRKSADPGKEQDAPEVFRGKLTDDELKRLQAAVPVTVPAFGPMRPGMPNLWIKSKKAAAPVEFRVPRDPDALAKVRDLVKVIEEISARLQKKP